MLYYACGRLVFLDFVLLFESDSAILNIKARIPKNVPTLSENTNKDTN